MTDWTATTERQPPRTGQYLVTIAGTVKGKPRTWVEQAEWGKNPMAAWPILSTINFVSPTWIREFGRFDPTEDTRITHWMRIPKPANQGSTP